jgi:hypothetical protein
LAPALVSFFTQASRANLVVRFWLEMQLGQGILPGGLSQIVAPGRPDGPQDGFQRFETSLANGWARATQSLPTTHGRALVARGLSWTRGAELAHRFPAQNEPELRIPHTLGQFNEVFFERVPFDAITPQALRNSAGVLRPGGRISIITGRDVNRAALQTNLRQAGFTNVQVQQVGTGNNAYVTATGTLGGR